MGRKNYFSLMESQYHKGFNLVKYMTFENLNMTNISKALLNKNVWVQGWHLVAGIVNPFCGFISFCIFSGLSVLPCGSVEWVKLKTWILVFASWHFNTALWCTSMAGEVRITCTQPSPPQGLWPRAQLSHRYTNGSPFTYSCCSPAKAGEETQKNWLWE